MSMVVEEGDIKWMRYALALAVKAADQGEVPVGAVIVRDEEVIGEGWNSPIGDHDATAHAEVKALRDAGLKQKNYRLPDATLYVTIEPCTMCAGALIHARIARIVYGAVESKSGVVESNPCIFEGDHLNHKLVYQGGVLAQECRQLISDFFKRRRAQKKADKGGVS